MSIVESKKMTAEEIASLIHNGEVLAVSGFTPAGYPKAVPLALAEKGKKLHQKGLPFKISLYTGASTGDEIDGAMARANIIQRRYPYQSSPDIRNAINTGEVEFADLHLSHVAQFIRYGFLPKPTTAILEAVSVTEDGKIYLSVAGGIAASAAMLADRIFIELNHFYGEEVIGLHDVYVPKPPPSREPIDIHKVGDRIGKDYIQVPVDKIAGIVETNMPDSTKPFAEPDADSYAIANNILDFFRYERKKGRLPEGLPFQSGVGNVANAVLTCMAKDPQQPPFSVYTEVMQDCLFPLLENEKLLQASVCSFTLSPDGQKKFKEILNQHRDKFVIRQQEISNNPEVVRRLGIISMNTALEFDIFGHVNSTHVMGSKMMNGIGGSGDFTRNCYLPIFMTPSIAKGGKISSIVPFCTHHDHNEHSTQIFVTEQGLADVRGLAPVARARKIIEKCVHPDYKDVLIDWLEYGLKHAPSRHTPLCLDKAFELHLRFLKTGSMLP